jgi:hypothetical protein
MKLLGYVMLACIVQAALKVAVTVLIMVLAIALIVSLILRPAEALGFVLLVIAANHPWPFAAVVLILAIMRLVFGRAED